MTSMTFTVMETPIGKGRPRVTRFGTYTPPKTREYEAKIRKAYLDAGLPVRATEDSKIPLMLSARFVFPIPKSVSKKKRIEMIDKHHVNRPDTDNCLKAILDALNGVAFPDDSAVSLIYGEKKYGEYPHIDITIMEVKE